MNEIFVVLPMVIQQGKTKAIAVEISKIESLEPDVFEFSHCKNCGHEKMDYHDSLFKANPDYCDNYEETPDMAGTMISMISSRRIPIAASLEQIQQAIGKAVTELNINQKIVGNVRPYNGQR